MPPPQQVRGRKGEREVGEVHDVALADATLPKEAWVTLCGWRFGKGSHVLLSGRQVTCAKCLAAAVARERRILL